MPEITSVEAVRAKLAEFDKRIDGAIAAAGVLSQIKRDAEGLLESIRGSNEEAASSRQVILGVRSSLEQIRQEWQDLRNEVAKSQSESAETRNLLLEELDSVIRKLHERINQAEERLLLANRKSLDEQANTLTSLEEKIRESSEQAKNASEVVVGIAGSLEDNLSNQLRSSSDLLRNMLKSHEESVHANADALRSELQTKLSDHQLAIDRQITDFLNKQNALIQNLSQQIDSYNRVSSGHTSDLQALSTTVLELSACVAAMEESLSSEQHALSDQMKEVGSRVQGLATALDDTIVKLRLLPLIGGKFK